MLFLARWQIESAMRQRVLERFVETGGEVPPGVTIVGRWHRLDGNGGFMIVEARNMHPLTEFALLWNDLLFVEITPVVTDAELNTILRKVKSRLPEPESGSTPEGETPWE